jgi:hypothetical protein
MMRVHHFLKLSIFFHHNNDTLAYWFKVYIGLLPMANLYNFFFFLLIPKKFLLFFYKF